MGRRNRIYILPTGFGLVFISGALVMILVGASYQNNLVNMLAFFMMSLIFIGMVQTHNNLKDLTLEQLIVDGGFAGETFMVTTVLGNRSAEPRFSLESRLRRRKPAVSYENHHPLLPKGQLKLRSSYKAGTRGLAKLTDVRVSTIFPLGLFRSWIVLPAEIAVHIYPKPEGDPLRELSRMAQPTAGANSMRGGDDFYGHRRYQVGDSPGHIDWRARAKKRPLLVKEFDQGAPMPLILDWFRLASLSDTEAKLSQLSLWVNECSSRRDEFGLRLPGLFIPPSSGLLHTQRCLEALAVFDEGDRDAA